MTAADARDLLAAARRRRPAGNAVHCGEQGLSYADLDTLGSLVDKSLLHKRDSKIGPRYWMLETIREYAAERLESSGEAHEMRDRHAQHYLALAKEAEPALLASQKPTPWLDPRYSPTTAPTKARPTLVCSELKTQLVALGR